MRSDRRHSRIHTFLFILLSIALAALASAATFRRGRATKSSNLEPVPAASGAVRSDRSSENSCRAGRSL
jgi:hypothetical protein